MQIKIRVPPSIATGRESLGAASLRLLQLALDAQMPPAPLPAKGLLPTSLYLSQDMAARLSAYPSPLGKSCSELIYAAYQSSRPTFCPAPTIYVCDGSDPNHWRQVNQDSLLNDTLRHCREGKIYMREVGTGFGKTRVLSRLAHQLAATRSPSLPVVLAVPTVADLAHFVSEWLALFPGDPVPSLYLGRSQFIVRDRLVALLEELGPGIPPNERSKIDQWIRDDGCPITGAGKVLAESIPGLAWLAMDLLSLCPSLPVQSLCLLAEDENCEDDPSPLRDEMIARIVGSRVIAVTHMALAANIRLSVLSKASAILFPMPGDLLVDEAHNFEATLATAFSNDLSLRSLRTWLRDLQRASTPAWRLASLLTTTLDQCDALFAISQSACESSPGFQLLLPAFSARSPVSTMPEYPSAGSSFTTLRESAGLLSASLAKLLKRLKKLSDTLPPSLRQRLSIFVGADLLLKCVADGSSSIFLTSSRVLHCPLFVRGPHSLKNVLVTLWDQCHSAVIVSGTLALPGKDGFSYSFMRQRLHIPLHRLVSGIPLIPPWITTIPTVHFLDGSLSSSLAHYPSRSIRSDASLPGSRSRYEQWIDVMSAFISRAFTEAVGGTLVLLNSFEDIDAFASRFSASLGSRLIVQSSRQDSALCKELFISSYLAGNRPVWLATGAAWTGLDLSLNNLPPQDDFLLSDLVIVRAPFGLNTSSTFLALCEWSGFNSVVFEAAMRFRQGIGRLIRRPGVTSRNLWLLDPRFHSTGGVFDLFGQIIAGFSKRKVLELPQCFSLLSPTESGAGAGADLQNKLVVRKDKSASG
jgi:ATP-dependent DNA helicase DinG